MHLFFAHFSTRIYFLILSYFAHIYFTTIQHIITIALIFITFFLTFLFLVSFLYLYIYSLIILDVFIYLDYINFNAEKISSAVKAFMNADLPQELIHLLERILHGSETSPFRENRSLENLLILTAIKSDRSRLTGLLARLEKYDAIEIAIFAIGKELYEEAFFIYKRFGMNALAVRVLIEHLKDIDRAAEFAASCEDPALLEILDNARVSMAANQSSAGDESATERGLSAEEVCERRWRSLIDSKKYSEAAVLATAAANQLIRTEKTLRYLKLVDSQAEQSSPLLLYMQNLLEQGRLNRLNSCESVEFCKELFKQNRKEEVQRSLKANRLECSEQLV